MKTLKYCCYCGSSLELKVPSGDNMTRAWCNDCKLGHYQPPTILVATFLHCNNKLLWTRRGIEPYKGKWAFPAGYVENGESLQDAAARELAEETHIQVSPETLIPMSISSVLPINQIYMAFRYPCEAELAAQLTQETQDWGWFSEAEAPWSEMAHTTSIKLVEQVYQAAQSNKFFMRIGKMEAHRNSYYSYAIQDSPTILEYPSRSS